VRRSVYNHSTAAVTLGPATYTETTNGAPVDRSSPALSNFRSAMLVVLAGTVTDGTHAIKLQESDNGSDWSDVDSGDLQGEAISVTTANDEQVHELGYVGHARYLRAVTTVADATSGGMYGAVIVLGDARRTPIPRS